MRPFVSFLRTDDIPQLTRQNYVAELRQMSGWGVVVGAVEGSMASVVVSKTFGASALLTTITWALPVLINVLNVGWGTVIRGRRRKPTFLLLAACGLVGVASIGLTSPDWKPWSGWAFAGQIAFTHLFLSGLITLRTTMWKVNYPASHRARIAGRLQTLRLLLSVITSGALSLLFNREPEYYRLVYPLVALVGFCSLLPLRRLRMRGEQAELRAFRRHIARNNNGSEHAPMGLRAGLREASAILRSDRLFARYMAAQFSLGAANFFTDPILVNLLTKKLDFDYFSSQALLYLVPTIVLLTSIHFWAPFFDRVGVLRFRIYNSACWVASYMCILGAAAVIGLGGRALLAPAIAILFIGRVLNGLGRGGGAIAWNLGHLHFAREHQTELYMSIHVGLTGVRGLVMPLLGLVASHLLGWGAFGIAVALALTAHIMFRRMASADRQPPLECAPDREEPGGPRADVT